MIIRHLKSMRNYAQSGMALQTLPLKFTHGHKVDLGKVKQIITFYIGNGRMQGYHQWLSSPGGMLETGGIFQVGVDYVHTLIL